MWFPNRSDTNPAAQILKTARSWKFSDLYLDLYYPCSENKGGDQLRGYRENVVFSRDTAHLFLAKMSHVS